MSVTGVVTNGVVVLPPGTALVDGTVVEVIPRPLAAADDPLVAAVQKLAKPRPHLPDDYALNHGHYLRGEPKQ
jgi:hypothetical protein